MAINLNNNADAMRQTLQNARVIAVVGHSDKPHRTSYRIADYLRSMGYTVYPVNPTIDSADGHQSYPSLADVPEPIDIVNIFRRPQHVSGIVDEAIDVGAKAIWAQIGVVDKAAAKRAIEAGIDVAMNRCIKVEHMRLDIDTLARQ